MATPKTCAFSPDIEIIDLANQLQEKWHRILENNLASTITENRVFKFELTNRGKSDIVSWSIELSLKIEEGDYLNKKFGINGESLKFVINSKSDQTIAPNQTINAPVILVGDFPRISFNWNISYKDLMEGEYVTNSNIDGFSNNNLIALNYKE